MGSNYHYSPKDYYHWISFLMESSTTLRVENSNFAISIFHFQSLVVFCMCISVSLYNIQVAKMLQQLELLLSFFFFVQKVGQEEKYKQYYEYLLVSRPSKFKSKLSHLLKCSKSVTHFLFSLVFEVSRIQSSLQSIPQAPAILYLLFQPFNVSYKDQRLAHYFSYKQRLYRKNLKITVLKNETDFYTKIKQGFEFETLYQVYPPFFFFSFSLFF